MPDVSVDDAERALASLESDLNALEGDDRVADAIARAVLDDAVQAASGRPSPQSRMAASGFEVRNGTITGAGTVSGTGGSADVSDVAGGSEYGSAIYPQFGPRSSGGLWMGPALRSEDATRAGERELERIVSESVG